jgi:hypothetical protein
VNIDEAKWRLNACIENAESKYTALHLNIGFAIFVD